MEGSIRLTIAMETHSLAQGDAFHFASSTPHGCANAAEQRSVVLWVTLRRSGKHQSR